MKRTLILCFIFLGWLHSAFGQATFNIDGFSEQYYGKVYFSDTTETSSAGWVEVYDRTTKEKLIHVDADELSFDLHNGKIMADIAEIPYGEHSVLLYEDYNFDGVKDFAIMDGFNSCYGGPSFQVFLATGKEFVFNDAFTELAQNYCGMFVVDYKNKIISTMEKSGCCLHYYSDFIVENNNPKLIRTRTDDCLKAPICTITIEEWKGKKMTKTVTSTIDFESEIIRDYFKFHVDKENKDIVLCNFNDDRLCYVILDAKQNVEFYYPFDELQQMADFKFDRKNGKLTFKNKDASYTIYDKSGNMGIDITYKGKNHQWKGNPKSRRGNLIKLMKVKFDNVVYQ